MNSENQKQFYRRLNIQVIQVITSANRNSH